VYIPKVYNGKDKMFFFFVYKALRLISPFNQSWRAPTQAMRNGDFQDLVDSQGRRCTKYPFSITPMPTLPCNPMLDSNWQGPAPGWHRD